MTVKSTKQLHGWLNLIKPPGMTSHDAVVSVRKLLGRPCPVKVGHIGTLDPAASGVLPICVGKATRLSSFLDVVNKSYIFEAVFGIETDTLDSQGSIISRSIPNIPEDAVKALLPNFIGEIEQTPPRFSAVHVNGKRAYRMAKNGEDFQLPSRCVTIHSLHLLSFSSTDFTALFEVTCSKGTYVRSLCADIGRVLGCGAYVGMLLRKSVGSFNIEDAWILEELAESEITTALLPLDYPLGFLPLVELDPEASLNFSLGKHLEGIVLPEPEYFRVYNDNNLLLGIGRKKEGILKPKLVLVPPQPELIPTNSDNESLS